MKTLCLSAIACSIGMMAYLLGGCAQELHVTYIENHKQVENGQYKRAETENAPPLVNVREVGIVLVGDIDQEACRYDKNDVGMLREVCEFREWYRIDEPHEIQRLIDQLNSGDRDGAIDVSYGGVFAKQVLLSTKGDVLAVVTLLVSHGTVLFGAAEGAMQEGRVTIEVRADGPGGIAIRGGDYTESIYQATEKRARVHLDTKRKLYRDMGESLEREMFGPANQSSTHSEDKLDEKSPP